MWYEYVFDMGVASGSDSYVKKGGESRSKERRCSCFEPDFLSGS